MTTSEHGTCVTCGDLKERDREQECEWCRDARRDGMKVVLHADGSVSRRKSDGKPAPPKEPTCATCGDLKERDGRRECGWCADARRNGMRVVHHADGSVSQRSTAAPA